VIIVLLNESASISFVFLWYILLAHRDLELGLGRGYVKSLRRVKLEEKGMVWEGQKRLEASFLRKRGK